MHPIERGQVEVGDRAEGHQPRRVHNHVDPAELPLRRVEHRRDRGLVRGVCLHGDGAATRPRDFARRRVRLRRAPGVVHHAGEAVAREARDHRPPDAAGGAGDDRGPASASGAAVRARAGHALPPSIVSRRACRRLGRTVYAWPERHCTVIVGILMMTESTPL
ncbi:MAG: hypothetical protein AVDCRST_MAG40-109 [uncultured Gemmatimonadaceae bacterium]|uniref:Uncharacterized protein n=1 Tax=uncultured Gemmatimonadaceae bacterium TaxID=246130 RepID=A0A6J4K5V4_9BACT|nr:MAG: hypothetical protein AVDCRST_MAG40-109 [uncultured Gemmatimonadaceae bacterium]